MTLDELPEPWRADAIRLAPKLQPGGLAHLTRDGEDRFLHCVGADSFVLLTTEERPPGSTARDPMATLGPKLWRELEAGAPTAEARRALAVGMLPRLPCGECRSHWAEALRETPPAVETAKAFHQWVWDRHNDVNRRKGRPAVPYPSAIAALADRS